MATIKRYNGSRIMEISDGIYKDAYGIKVYELTGNKIKHYNVGNYLYEISDDVVREYCGQQLITFDGTFIRRYCGGIIYELKGNVIKDFNGANVYEIDGRLSRAELMGLFAILFA